MAPGIADGWPEVIPAPHTRNGRLVRRVYPSPDPDERNAARCKAISEALGIEDESTSKQVEAITALRELVDLQAMALRKAWPVVRAFPDATRAIIEAKGAVRMALDRQEAHAALATSEQEESDA